MTSGSGNSYQRIVSALDEGRRALGRARFTAGLLRFLGIALATVAALILWAVLQRLLRFYSVPVATLASVIGAGIVVFGLVRWIVIPLVRLPGRDRFVELVEEKFPEEKNLIVNAYQLGNESRDRGASGDLIDVLVAQAAGRIRDLDIRRWRDPSPDRPYLWAGGAAIAVVAALSILSPSLLTGAVGQVLRPTLAKAPPVSLAVNPGDIEVERGSDVTISVEVEGTGKTPVLRFRERGGEWRLRDFRPASAAAVDRDGGDWTTQILRVDRRLEYQVQAQREETALFTIRVKEPPRIAGYRALLDYPDYAGLTAETVEAGSGDLAALKGTEVDLRVLTNRRMGAGFVEWKDPGAEEPIRKDLEPVDDTTWRLPFRLMEPASYAVVFTDDDGSERLRSPVYRVDPTPDRAPYLTLHLPQDDHDLYEDMMEKIVADAADDYGFSSVRLYFRVDDGPERYTSFQPYTAGQNEFRLDTLWDMSGLDMLPGAIVSFYVEVRDNDTVSGPKAVKSEVRRVRFPTISEMYTEVAEEHDQEIENLAEVQEEQAELSEKLEKLTNDLKAGKEMNWETQQDMENALERQQSLEEQVSEVLDRLQETLNKASSRAQMNQQLVQKMSELNELLDSVANEDMQRAFQKLSDALKSMDRNQVRDALENLQTNQEQMLQGLDRTIELLKQIRKEEQVEDVVRRTEEIAQLQEQLTEKLKELGAEEPEGSGEEAAENADGEQADPESMEQGDPTDGESADAENRDGEQDGEAPENESEGESQDGETGEPQDGEPQDGEQAEPGEQNEQQDGEPQDGEQGENQQGDPTQLGMTPEMKELMKEMEDLAKQIAEERSKLAERRTPQDPEELAKKLEQLQEQMERLEEQQKLSENQQGENQQGEQQQGQQNQKQNQQQGEQQGEQSQQGQNQQNQQQDGQEQQQQKSSPKEQEKLKRLAEEQKQIEQMVEELKRQLETLRKLNQEDQNLAKDLESMETGETTQQMQESMQQAGQQMQGGGKQESAKYAFKARDEAQKLAQMAQEMQQQMEQRLEDDSIERMQAVIEGLIDVSGVEQVLFEDPESDDRELAARQFSLVEKARALSDSLQALARQSFAVNNQQTGKLGEAIDRMERSTRFYELGNLRSARHEGRESSSDLNETIVQLMKSHSQMCSGSSGGSQMQQMLQKMRGLSEAQQQVNDQTGSMSRNSGQNEGRLSMSEQERMKWLAAQQEMIRQGLQDVRNEFQESKDLLGDMDGVVEDMTEVEGLLEENQLGRQLLERQQQILSRLLDAQRSIRQQEMSPERQSRTGTLAQRDSPPELPADLLVPDRTLEEDVLRGANDRYPVQYRRLVEDYFRSLAKESRNP